jgi:dihydropteroate synthase
MQKRMELVGVLNITPDSFSDGGLYYDQEKALIQANQLFNEGASLLDVGAESTRPGATPLKHEEEWYRLQPLLGQLVFSYPEKISLDTHHPETVRLATKLAGPLIINDVTGFNNPEMIEAVADLDLRCIVSHLPDAYGQLIQEAHKAEQKVDSVNQVRDELLAKREAMTSRGIYPPKIILDPGIGFGKTPKLNWKLLEFAQEVPGIDVMIGYSRKRFLGKHRMELEPNLAAGAIAVRAGARYLRVHDVAGHKALVR